MDSWNGRMPSQHSNGESECCERTTERGMLGDAPCLVALGKHVFDLGQFVDDLDESLGVVDEEIE